MQEATYEEIRMLAFQCDELKKLWHFHILTPGCKLNDSNQFAFVFENSTDQRVNVCYSDTAPMALGNELVKVLHNVLRGNQAEAQKKMSEQGKYIFARAKKLNTQGKFWHHHLLFPDCIFNHSGKWMIMFEDQEKGETLEALSDNEPKADLEKIEALYYQQKDLK